jgi:hypothetical protein
MATLFILIGLLPCLLCELPAIPIRVSKETTFITEPLAGDGLPNYALAIQELEKKGVVPEQNGAIPFWQAMGQYQLSDEEFERLSREIGLSPDGKIKPLVPLDDESTIQAVKGWLRETGRSSDDEELEELADEYVAWVQTNPWTDEDVPPLAKWLTENEQALDQLVEASKKPQFYSPYPNLLVDRTVSVLDIQLQHVTGVRTAIRALMARAMYWIAQDDLGGAWSDCQACLAFSNHLTKSPFLVTHLVAIQARKSGLKAVCEILSRSNVSPALARKILEYAILLDSRINVSESFNFYARLQSLDYMLRMATDRLGGMRVEDKDKYMTKIVKAKFDLNLSLRWINEHYDRIVLTAKIEDGKERAKLFKELEDDFVEESERIEGLSKLGGLSHTFRSNAIGEISFMFTFPDLTLMGESLNHHDQFLDLAKIAAALAVYKAEHGHYPKELAELSPTLLKAIPDDLYIDKPLRYKPMGGGYLLYSLFENEIDDNATDVDGEIRDGEWQDETQEIEREKCDLVIRIPVVPRPKP